jgi:hypothetical protein
MPVLALVSESYSMSFAVAGNSSWVISYVDHGPNGTPTYESSQGQVTAPGQVVVVSQASSVNPEPGHARELQFFCIRNNSLTVTQTVSFGKIIGPAIPGQYFAFTPQTTLLPGETVVYVQNAGFQVFNAAGLQKLALVPGTATTSQVDSPSGNGFTVSIADGVLLELINGPNGFITGVTINFPPNPILNQTLTIATVQAISGMTCQPAGLIANAPSSLSAGSSTEFVWLNGVWNHLR